MCGSFRLSIHLLLTLLRFHVRLNFVEVFRCEAGDMKAFCRSGLRKEQFSRESGLGDEFLLRVFAKIKVEKIYF